MVKIGNDSIMILFNWFISYVDFKGTLYLEDKIFKLYLEEKLFSFVGSAVLWAVSKS